MKVEITGQPELELRVLAKRYRKTFEQVISHSVMLLWQLEQQHGTGGKVFETYEPGRIDPDTTGKLRRR